MASKYPTTREIAAALNSALCELYSRDKALLSSDANERSITHRLATYLEYGLPGWDVDCEYNRALGHGGWKKVLSYDFGQEKIAPDDMEAKSVFPDIIAHHRDTNENLLVIEVKKANSLESDAKDLSKLRAFTDPKNLGYQIGLFLRIGKDSTTMHFASRGKVRSDQLSHSPAAPHDTYAVIRQNLEVLDYGG